MSETRILANGSFFGGVVSRSESNGLTLAETTYAPGFEVPSHQHTTPFVCVAVEGSFVESFESDAYEMEPGAMFDHPGPGVHGERFGGRGGHCFVAQMEASWVEAVGARGLQSPTRFMRAAGDRSAALAIDCYWAFRQGDLASSLVVEGLVVDLLTELSGVRHVAETRRPGWLRHANDLVHDRYLVRRLRLDHARELLATSERELSEIAIVTGFTDQSHFTRFFKRRFSLD